MKNVFKVLSLALCIVLVMGMLTACGDKNDSSSSGLSQAGINGDNGNVKPKPSADSVIKSYATGNKKAEKVENEDSEVVETTIVTVDEDTKTSIFANAASGIVNGMSIKIENVSSDRDGKLKTFYTEIKAMAMAIDDSLTDEQADEIVNYLKQAAPESASSQTTRSVENNGLNYSIFFSEDVLSFVVT